MKKIIDTIFKGDLTALMKISDIKEKINKPYNENGWTPFLLIVKEFYETEIIEDFIKLGGNVNTVTKQGLTPLMIASQHRSSPDVIELLLQYGADINYQDNYGYTAIMKLLEHPQLSMRKYVLRTLINNGSDLINLKNIECKTSADMIIERL